MSLILGEEQQLLKQSAAEFLRRESPLSRVREMRDNAAGEGFSRQLWSKMAELGWQGITIPECYGGLGLGFAELVCVLEECGRRLVPEPLLSTVLLGANAVLAAGREEQKKEILPRVADGSLLLALAYQERGGRYRPWHCETRLEVHGDSLLLNGEKTMVYDGAAADILVVSARSSGDVADAGGLSLVLVEATTPGVEVVEQSTMHLRKAALVRLKDCELAAERTLGPVGSTGAMLADVIDRATLGLSAFEMTLDYLKTRRQFGVAIGSFQALKHRAAQLFVETELARSAVMGAAQAVDGGADDGAALVSVAKARCSDAAVAVGYEGIQMHGGIGMTDEHDIGLFAKRARGSELTFGDAAYHRDRFARLQGF